MRSHKYNEIIYEELVHMVTNQTAQGGERQRARTGFEQGPSHNDSLKYSMYPDDRTTPDVPYPLI